MIYTINNCIRAFGYTNFDKLIADMGSVDNLREYVRANGYADIAVAEDTELLLVDVNGKTWHTGCYGAKLEPEVEPDYLCFTSKSYATVKTIGAKKTIANTTYIQHLFFDYKINDGEWQRLKPGSISGESEEITLQYNDKLYVKADDWGPNEDVPKDVYTRIYIGGEAECSGNIMSLCGFKKALTHEYQFYNLFHGSNITTAPKLPATTLTYGCYKKMFSGCTSLVQAPELPATTLAQFCYADMFDGCTSLVNAPTLPALELADNCYWGMFGGCSKLNYVKALFLESYNSGNMADWLSGVSPTGTFVKNPDATWQYAQPNIPSGWTIKTTTELEQGSLCFTSTGDSTVAMQQNGTPDKSAGKVIQYKLNDGQWQTWDLSIVTLTDGDKMYLKSDDYIPISEAYDIYKSFVMTGSIAASGNIMSLLNFSGILTNYAFKNLFENCTSLTTAPELPATRLTAYCYNYMFSGCTSLTTAPVLPATTLSDMCYQKMFSGCTSLTTAPELPAEATYGCYSYMFEDCTSLTTAPTLPSTIIITSCYEYMFSGCTSLTTAPELPATTLQSVCYQSMFSGCTSLTTAPELPATTLEYSCYGGMFSGCTSLTTAPALPATTLTDYCYQNMFYNCTALVNAPALPATTLADYCYQNMFYNCTALVNAPALPATTLSAWCYYWMFYGCTSLTTAPELPATTLADWCYGYMFNNCTNLNYVKAMFTTDPSSGSYIDSWLNYVSSTGTFVKNASATWTNEQAGIPTGWTVQVEGGVTPEPEPERDYLCFTSTGDSTVAMTQYNVPNVSAGKVIQYKINNGEWQTWNLSAVTLVDGDKMYLKSDDEIPMAEANLTHKQFNMTGSIATSGNIMSLLNFSDTLPDYAFCSLFSGCTSLTTAPELPATTLADNCYNSMFSDCTSLTQAPALPATTLADHCYDTMFYGCTSLVQAPELPATTLALACYSYMFNGCSNLNYVKAMFTTYQLLDTDVNMWLYNVSATGTFVKNSAATWTKDEAGIPSGWTVQTATPDK